MGLTVLLCVVNQTATEIKFGILICENLIWIKLYFEIFQNV